MKGIVPVTQLDRVSSFYLESRGFESLPERQIMNINNSTRETSKTIRLLIKHPTKLCDCCMSQWEWTTLQEEKLCDECYREKYVKTEVG